MSRSKRPASLPLPAFLRRARGGDPGAWRALYDRYHRIVYAACLSAVGHGGLADDDAAETWLEVMKRLLADRIGPKSVPGVAVMTDPPQDNFDRTRRNGPRAATSLWMRTFHPRDRLLDGYCAGALRPRRARALESHLRSCSRCVAELERRQEILAALMRQLRRLEVPDVWGRVISAARDQGVILAGGRP